MHNNILSNHLLHVVTFWCDTGGRPIKNPTHLDSNDRSDGQGRACERQLKQEHAAELPIYSFESIVLATNNFDINNKLGQGGFGSGRLNDGREVAAKRLASSSSQGLVELKNEVILISRLQHRNLVRLIGWCVEREEQILLYEYLPNKSLDTILFEEAKLNWSQRFTIILGVAKGLLYLHKESSLRIIHRDLKVSNILLDDKMNPKISDFGLAKMFEGTQDLVNTRRIVGTLGYMSPEYAMGGAFSEKSDVYSFGVLVMEIVSGRKNNDICLLEDCVNLLSYAWELWCQGRGLDLVDDQLCKFSTAEAMRCIQVSLLCVQDQATDRPDMATVVFMLSGESELPQPKRLAFAFRSIEVQPKQSSTLSTNSMTNSTLGQGR
ncbi:hypothetical protein MLD38_010004 [Melastoma candidum]|uniref:Uncharacterized protein n=1 Tax=Melastoma candidum TaxID=119954 RepID=A0ACB9R6T7_9MYRT|nr:hypothetical protein MLD38_010004 [Melastoma candidum]